LQSETELNLMQCSVGENLQVACQNSLSFGSFYGWPSHVVLSECIDFKSMHDLSNLLLLISSFLLLMLQFFI